MDEWNHGLYQTLYIVGVFFFFLYTPTIKFNLQIRYFSPPGSSFMEFSRQECWSGLPFPSPGNLPDPGINPGSSVL